MSCSQRPGSRGILCQPHTTASRPACASYRDERVAELGCLAEPLCVSTAMTSQLVRNRTSPAKHVPRSTSDLAASQYMQHEPPSAGAHVMITPRREQTRSAQRPLRARRTPSAAAVRRPNGQPGCPPCPEQVRTRLARGGDALVIGGARATPAEDAPCARASPDGLAASRLYPATTVEPRTVDGRLARCGDPEPVSVRNSGAAECNHPGAPEPCMRPT
ncbi:hypothetical protein C8Q77DRAFT_911094 [Trametes polyzona]|nr:hypothetical protein C8Q77DRAFT_911094 [Trametes polyzona]